MPAETTSPASIRAIGIRMPAAFIGHGTPMTILMEDDYTADLKKFAASLPRPRAIVAVSAHGLSAEGTVDIVASGAPRLIYDFRGFPAELYQMKYSCPGDPDLAVKIAGLVSASGFQPALAGTGLDHGVWIPLKVMFPEADIPVVQVSMPYPTSPLNVLKLGKSLAPLRDEGVLLMGSGGVVHNLERLKWHQKHGEPAGWASEFGGWVKDRLGRKSVAELLEFETLGPHAALAQPSAEHFYPLFFTLGASHLGDQLALIHEGIQYETLSMLSFALTPGP